jgi:acetyl esterase/lipase
MKSKLARYLLFALLFIIVCGAAIMFKASKTYHILVYKDQVYAGKKPTRYHTLDVYVPKDLPGPLPLVIFIHGGGWQVGDKGNSPCGELSKAGFVSASINYRFTDEGRYPAQIHDAKAAVRWLRAHAQEFKIDPSRVGVWGMSAGGHLAALLGTSAGVKEVEGGDLGNKEQSSAVQAVCDCAGPSDLLSITDQADKDNELDLDAPDGIIARLLGGLPKDKKEMARRASPVSFVGKGNPPFLIVHGDKDTVVPFEQSTELYDKLVACDVPARMVKVAGGGHQVISPDVVALAISFFEKYLKH